MRRLLCDLMLKKKLKHIRSYSVPNENLLSQNSRNYGNVIVEALVRIARLILEVDRVRIDPNSSRLRVTLSVAE